MSKHHSHEISEHPEVQWALDLLKPDPTYDPGVTQYTAEVVCMGFGFSVPSLNNYLNSRPFYAGECQLGFSPPLEIAKSLDFSLSRQT
ncbi:uncharacterized protein LOC112466529 [Temnothorax curvispinosus]|uniref:Uncharacterized protein LOC112466529 n=1 Tax=Temnothorax curvispinosus TaxID=300111 RepID=A0A6J1R881_9HYME|nr:uncharacterized protein LOC112466529 [Temnothorax curvispinosus]